MSQITNINETSPIKYRNGIMVLGAKQTARESESCDRRNYCDDDLDVITPLHRHKLRYVIRDL